MKLNPWLHTVSPPDPKNDDIDILVLQHLTTFYSSLTEKNTIDTVLIES